MSGQFLLAPIYVWFNLVIGPWCKTTFWWNLAEHLSAECNLHSFAKFITLVDYAIPHSSANTLATIYPIIHSYPNSSRWPKPNPSRWQWHGLCNSFLSMNSELNSKWKMIVEYLALVKNYQAIVMVEWGSRSNGQGYGARFYQLFQPKKKRKPLCWFALNINPITNSNTIYQSASINVF